MLQVVRESYGLSVADLAILSDISMSAIYRIENPERNPYKTNEGVAKALADALDCEVGDIFSHNELSHQGRPAHTGKPIAQLAPDAFINEMTCLDCYLIVPVHIGCENCGERKAA